MFRGCLSGRDKKTTQWFNLFKEEKRDATLEQAIEAANLIVHAGEEETQRALLLAEQNPKIFDCEVRVKDRLGREITGDIITIAAKVGDTHVTDAYVYSPEKEDKGMVNRLIEVNRRKNYSSPKRIIKCLEAVNSPEAKLINARRNRNFLMAMIAFAEGLIALKDDENFTANCTLLAIQLDEKLKKNIRQSYAMGFVFDLQIMCDFLEWYCENEQRFGNPRLDIWYDENEKKVMSKIEDPFFWKKINALGQMGYGKFQALLSARDAHAVLDCRSSGTPLRTLNNADETTYFLSNPFVSGHVDDQEVLGRDYCLSLLRGEPDKKISEDSTWTRTEIEYCLRYYKQIVASRHGSLQLTVHALQQTSENCLTM